MAETPCSEPYPAAPTHIEAEAKASTFVTSKGTIACGPSILSGHPASSAGTSDQIALSSMVFSECGFEKGGDVCKVNAQSLGQMPISALEAYAGDATLSEARLLIACKGTMLPVAGCQYNGEIDFKVQPTASEAPASITMEGSLTNEVGCSKVSEVKLHAEYQVHSPKSTYVSTFAEAPTLCAAEESPCEEFNVFPAGSGTQIELTASEMMILTAASSITCPSTQIRGELANGLGEPLRLEVTSAVFEKCTDEGYNCTVTAGLGWMEISAFNQTLGEAAFNHMTLQAKCSIAFLPCTYAFEREGPASLQVADKGGVLELSVKNAELEAFTVLCPELSLWDARFKTSSPEPIYLSS